MPKRSKELAGQHTVELEMQHLDMYKLYKVFNKVMKRYANEQNQPIHSIVPYPYSIAGQKEWLLADYRPANDCLLQKWQAYSAEPGVCCI